MLLVSSLRPRCGRTSVALGIAQARATGGRRVAFVGAAPEAMPDFSAAFPGVAFVNLDTTPEHCRTVVVDMPPGPPEPLADVNAAWLVLCPATAADDLDAFLDAARDDETFCRAVGVLTTSGAPNSAERRQALTLRIRHGRRAAAKALPVAGGWPDEALAAACHDLARELLPQKPSDPASAFVPHRTGRSVAVPVVHRSVTPAWQVWSVAALLAVSLAALHWQVEVARWAALAMPALRP